MHEVLAALRAFYGPLAPPPRDLFAFVVWEVVSSRTLPARRDMAWTALKRLPALTPDAMFRTSKADLEAALEMVGAREERIDHLRGVSRHFRRHRDLPHLVAGPLAGAVRALARVPHLTRGARMRALLICGGHVAAGVDEGVSRVVVRLRGLPSPNPAARRRSARARVRSESGGGLERVIEAAMVLGHHARHACAEHAPHCHVCPVRADCRHALAGPTADPAS
jgi:endonuclease III